jgi:uncharacterized membrane protein YozB (DUF420 family)
MPFKNSIYEPYLLFYATAENTDVPAIIGASSVAVVVAMVILAIAVVCIKQKKTEKTMHAIAVAVSK